MYLGVARFVAFCLALGMIKFGVDIVVRGSYVDKFGNVVSGPIASAAGVTTIVLALAVCYVAVFGMRSS